MKTVRLTPITPEAFAPFGTLIAPPAEAGTRNALSEHVAAAGTDLAPQFHTNHVMPRTLPLAVETLEHHPHAAQAFVPLSVSRYLVVVAPSGADGEPNRDAMTAFLAPGDRGVIYKPRVWHLGATVLDQPASFAVLMWRGRPDDDVFSTISPVSVHEAQTGTGKEVA